MMNILDKLIGRFKYSDRHHTYWKSLNQKYSGRRGFIIGNGPSLKIQDLDSIKSEITIASNKIFLAFDQTEWRPTIFTVADPLLWPKISSEVENIFDIFHIPTNLDSSSQKAIFWKHNLTSPFKRFSHDATKGIFGGQTITYQNIQIAVYLGLNPIYLIGCDHHYPGEKNVKANVPVLQTGQNSHFIKGYRYEGEKVMPAPISKMNFFFNEAKRYCHSRNIEIFNATRGGNLDIFERKSIEEVLDGNI